MATHNIDNCFDCYKKFYDKLIKGYQGDELLENLELVDKKKNI